MCEIRYFVILSGIIVLQINFVGYSDNRAAKGKLKWILTIKNGISEEIIISSSGKEKKSAKIKYTIQWRKKHFQGRHLCVFQKNWRLNLGSLYDYLRYFTQKKHYRCVNIQRGIHIRCLTSARVAYWAQCIHCSFCSWRAHVALPWHFAVTWTILIFYIKMLTVHSQRNAVKIRDSLHCHATSVSSR